MISPSGISSGEKKSYGKCFNTNKSADYILYNLTTQVSLSGDFRESARL